MKKQKSPWLVFLSGSLLVAFLGGCTSFIQTASPSPAPDELYTQAAETVIADLTLNAPAYTPTLPPAFPTDTPILPTSTMLPTATFLPSPTSTQPPTQPPLSTATQL